MWRYVAWGAALLALAGAAVLVIGRARSGDAPLLPNARATIAGSTASPLPAAAPEASPATREERRFGRYDKDRDGAVTREEYLANRRKAFAKLDVDHDGTLSFDEWSTKAIVRFAGADRDKSGAMTPAEFATTAVKRSTRRPAPCPPAQAQPEEES